MARGLLSGEKAGVSGAITMEAEMDSPRRVRPRRSLAQRLGQAADTLRGDLRLAWRTMTRRPGITALIVASLAIGLGANVSVFALVDAVMIRSLPYDEAGRLVEIGGMVPSRGWLYVEQSLLDFVDFREQSRTLDVAGYYASSFNLVDGGRPERVDGQRVSWNFFKVLRVQPTMGRTFRPEEERAGRSHVAIISFALWQRRFAAATDALGHTLAMDGTPYTIVGVLPDGFRFEGEATDVWVPFGLTGQESRSRRWMRSLGRLRPGFEMRQAQSEVQQIAARLQREYPDTNQEWSAAIRPLRERVFGARIRTISLVSAMAVAFVLLIACANVANLQMARTADRAREMALRGALGASRGRLVRQLLTEAAALAVAAGALGTIMAVGSLGVLRSLLPQSAVDPQSIRVDGRVLLFALLATVFTAVLFGTVPALRGVRSALAPVLREGHGAVGSPRTRLSYALVIGEVALALTLLVCSALLMRGFSRLVDTDWGWDPHHVLAFQVSLPESAYADDASVAQFYERLSSELRTLPGVEAVGGNEILPLQGESSTFYNLVGREVPRNERPTISARATRPGYFKAMGIAVVEGRPVAESDRIGSPPVIVVNEALARRHWRHAADAIGHKLRFWGEDQEIVGVVRDTREFAREARPMGFIPAGQLPLRSMSIVVRSRQEPTSLAGSVRAVVARLDPGLPAYRVASMTELMREKNGVYRVMPRVVGGLAATALLLGLLGVYGVISKSVSQRTQEVGVRMALGATPGGVLRLILRQGGALVGTGAALGLGISALVTRHLGPFLFGVSPWDGAALTAVTLLLMATGLAASLIPARRATRVSPVRALRDQ